MGKYTYILFDLDGTLTDPQLGITKSVQYALARMGIVEPDLKKLIPFIGPPLAASFQRYCDVDEKRAWEAVLTYREYYSVTGIFENAVYPEIAELLAALRADGRTLAVATSKPEVFARRILAHYELIEYFQVVVGSNLDGSMVEKAEVVACVLDRLGGPERQAVVMVGDRMHDIVGARQNGIDSVAVGYGYGTEAELKAANPTYYARTVKDLRDCLLLDQLTMASPQ